MSIFASQGLNVLDSLKEKQQQEQNQEKIDFKKLYINLKDGESVNIKILGPDDVVEYRSHGDFTLGLFNQTCTKPAGKPCAFCEAVKYADENKMDDWSQTYAKPRFLFAFYDLDMQAIRIFNATKNQAKTLLNSIQEYKEHLSSVSFKLSRSGNKTETVYSLAPQLTFKSPELKATFEAVEEVVTPETFENALIVRGYDSQVKLLGDLNFPVEAAFAKKEQSTVITEEDYHF